MIPEEIVEATRIEANRQKTSYTKFFFQKHGYYFFHWSKSDKKYGKTTSERLEFWAQVLMYKNFDIFYKINSNHQKITIEGQEFII